MTLTTTKTMTKTKTKTKTKLKTKTKTKLKTKDKDGSQIKAVSLMKHLSPLGASVTPGRNKDAPRELIME